MCSRTMPSSHVTVAHRHGARHAQVTVLAVHVVGSRAGVITQPDSKILDFGGGALWDLQIIDTMQCHFQSVTVT